jgi:hypothetical protein
MMHHRHGRSTQLHYFALVWFVCAKIRPARSAKIPPSSTIHHPPLPTPMKYRVDLKIDCIFKALLGSEVNRNPLIHFLNAVLAAPITGVDILNPYNTMRINLR